MSKKNKLEQKKSKDLAAKVLRAQGKDYDEWLKEKHQEIINNNSNVIDEALGLFISQKAKQES